MNMTEKAVVWHEVQIDVRWGSLRGKTCVVDGPPDVNGDELRIVGLHGWLDNCNTYDSLVSLLPSKAKVLVLDLPGHGLSDHLPLGAHYNPFVYASNIQTAVMKLGWKKFVLMGHSMGAAVSCVFTALFPELVTALIMLDYIAPLDLTSFVERCRTYAIDLLKAEKLALEPPLVYSEKEAIERLVAGRVLRDSDEPTIGEEAAQTLLPRSTREVDGGYVWSHDRKARSTFLVFISGKNWIETISAIKCPVLLIVASHGADRFPLQYKKKLFEVYERNAEWFQTETVEGRHHVHLTDPERVAPLINRFLTRVEKERPLLPAKL